MTILMYYIINKIHYFSNEFIKSYLRRKRLQIIKCIYYQENIKWYSDALVKNMLYSKNISEFV
jgi:hypothetical protein